ncbi:hypothetical protein FGB62_59g051 [Gracilaria domingensis]|nr:hypothetical protein FGB62_59g051 [Gracilaria domingensis]
MSAFVPSFSFAVSAGFPANRCPYKAYTPVKFPTKRLTPRATSGGWTETRLGIPDLKVVSGGAEASDLPGIHFEAPPSITANDLLNIIKGDTPDEWVNEILRTLLGWRKLDGQTWNDELVSPEWKEPYPNEPPNFIGIVDNYSPSIDRPVMKAVQKLSRSVPNEYKQLLKPVLRPLGFFGWKINELTPNRTRRAQAVNWILYWYRVHYPDHEWR